jgi:adenosylcobinamide-GDP ribazoletransferase
MLRAFEIAVGFLTIFRVRLDPIPDMAEAGRSAWAFPLVGALLGILLVVAHTVLSAILPVSVVALLVVGFWVVLTGGLHLDGWTDCWDAMAASVPPERRREILKDSRLGTFGALALILLVAIKATALAGEHFPKIMLFLAPVIGRGALVVVAYGTKNPREGMGAQFCLGMDSKTVRWAAILGFGPALIAGWTGILGVVAAYLGSLWFRRLAESRLAAVNGDVIGAMCELSEALVLLTACLHW